MGANLGPRGLIGMNMGVFDLNMSKWSWGHSMHFFSYLAVTWKQFIVEVNGRSPGHIMYQHGSLGFEFQYVWPQACQCHLGVIRCTLINIGPWYKKNRYCRLKWKNLTPVGVCGRHMGTLTLNKSRFRFGGICTFLKNWAITVTTTHRGVTRMKI